MMILPAILLAAGVGANPTPQDSITIEIVTGSSSSGWAINADGSGEMFDRDLVSGAADRALRQAFVGPTNNFVAAHTYLIKYRALARTGTGCPIARTDVFGFRLTWIEAGARHTATFTDSCGGIPADLDEALRPIARLIDPLLASPPPAPGASTD